MKRRDETDPGARAAGIEAELNARRRRIAANLTELSERMTAANLMNEAREAVMREVDMVVDRTVALGSELAADSLHWLRANRTLVAGGSATALVAAGLVWYLARRRTVPLYAAYDVEDDFMTDEQDRTIAGATGTWNKVKGEAQHLGDRAGEAYYSARSRAADLSETTRERAREAADAARERAHEAAEAARDAADKAREAAGEARRWAVRQPQDNPGAVVLGALAVGIIIGVLIPSGQRDRA